MDTADAGGGRSLPAASTVASVRATQAPADLIVVNGRVFTGAGSPTPEALAMRGPLIAAVGTRADVEAMQGPSTTIGRRRRGTVLPGFNDSHVHFLSGAQSLQELDLSGARTLDEVQQRIRDFAAGQSRRRPGSAAAAGTTGRSRAACRRRAQLDAALSDRPAALVCFDGHSTWVNSKALQAAGITADTPDPANGEITRKAGTREPEGLLKESAQGLVRKVMPAADARRSSVARWPPASPAPIRSA